MRLITSGSDRLPDELYQSFQQAFGYTLVERYGLTETGINCSNPLSGDRRMGSVGLPLPGVEARIADRESGSALPDGDVGEVQIRGANVFKGYWSQPQKKAEAFTADGWFRTGDLGFRQPDGYLTLCGRSKDLIVSGGMNIYPPEVERVLSEHPAVDASAVIGCPDAEWGERVTAVVVLKDGLAASSAELIAFCREKLAPYKCPRTVVFRPDVPRNAMGKVQKGDLRAEVCEAKPKGNLKKTVNQSAPYADAFNVTDQGLACTVQQSQVNPGPTAQETRLKVSIASQEWNNVCLVPDLRVNSSTARTASTVCFYNRIRVAARKAGKGDSMAVAEARASSQPRDNDGVRWQRSLQYPGVQIFTCRRGSLTPVARRPEQPPRQA